MQMARSILPPLLHVVAGRRPFVQRNHPRTVMDCRTPSTWPLQNEAASPTAFVANNEQKSCAASTYPTRREHRDLLLCEAFTMPVGFASHQLQR
jgi:hypothetical protein